MSILTQLDAFLAADTLPSRTLRSVLANFTSGEGESTAIIGHALLGGAIRDINADGAAADPRDFDIVVDSPIGTLRSLFRKPEYGNRSVNALNGFHFETEDGIKFDVWAIRETWAIRRGAKRDAEFADLMTTTFFNLEAVAVEFAAKAAEDPFPDPARIVLDGGYNAAVSSGILELNNSKCPSPLIQMVRTCSFVKRLGMTLGPNLEDWILANAQLALIDDRLAVAQSVYFGEGNEPCTAEEMRTTLDAALTAAANRAGVPVPSLPPPPPPEEEP